MKYIFQKKLVMFVFFRNEFTAREVISWIVYSFPNDNSLRIVGGSIWFMSMYIKVSIISSLVIIGIKNAFKEDMFKIFPAVLVFSFFLFFYCFNNDNFLFFDSYLSFYIFVYLLGYYLHNYRIRSFGIFVLYEAIAALLMLGVFKIYDIGILQIQNIKFPPSMPYLFFSLLSIILFWYLKDVLKIKKNNPVNYIGKNAIFFYYSQGVACSLSYFIYKYIVDYNTIVKFIICFSFNVIVASLIAFTLNTIYSFVSSKSKRLVFNSLLPTKKD